MFGTIDKKKICFIIAVSDEEEFNECRLYISRLSIPIGFEVSIVPVKGCKSLAAAYNIGMRESDAKYKVYLHQDVMIINPNFMYDILTVFKQDSKIGMLGVIGAPKLSKSGIMSYSERVGNLYCYDNENVDFGGYQYNKIDGYTEVECIDGFLMATSQDVDWREDLFDGWDYYDLAQSFEMRKKGYKVVVPNQTKPWCVHDNGSRNIWSFDLYRRLFLKEYMG